MYNYNKPQKTTCIRAYNVTGETIEKKMNRILQNKEPIKDGAPLIYTDRSDGILDETNIRTDRFENLIDATTKMTGSHLAAREKETGEATYDTMTPEQQKEFNTKFPTNKHNMKNAGGESTHGTDTQNK